MRITVYGVGRGAAILIELPGKGNRVGIIDCFRGGKDKHPLLTRLTELAKDGDLRIEFLVLTHLHADHFFGVGEILSAFGCRIQGVWDSGVDFDHVVISEFSSDKVVPTLARRELEVLGKRERTPLTSNGITVWRDDELGIIIKSIAPHSSMLGRVHEKFKTHVQKLAGVIQRLQGGESVEELPRTGFDLNRTSSALHLSVGGRSVLFCGDVVTDDWTLLDDAEVLNADVIIVGHHGAVNAHHEYCYRKANTNSERHAIVSGRGEGQPAAEVVRELCRSGFKVRCTHSPIWASSKTLIKSLVTQVHYGAVASGETAGDITVDLGPTVEIAGGCKLSL